MHAALLVLELSVIEQLLGHLYWIAHSKVEVSSHFVTLEPGLIGKIGFRPALIESLEFANFEPTEPKIPKMRTN